MTLQEMLKSGGSKIAKKVDQIHQKGNNAKVLDCDFNVNPNITSFTAAGDDQAARLVDSARNVFWRRTSAASSLWR